MTTIDAQGNLHDGKGQFSEKANTAPAGTLAAPEIDVVRFHTDRYYATFAGVGEAIRVQRVAQFDMLAALVRSDHPDAGFLVFEWRHEDEGGPGVCLISALNKDGIEIASGLDGEGAAVESGYGLVEFDDSREAAEFGDYDSILGRYTVTIGDLPTPTPQQQEAEKVRNTLRGSDLATFGSVLDEHPDLAATIRDLDPEQRAAIRAATVRTVRSHLAVTETRSRLDRIQEQGATK